MTRHREEDQSADARNGLKDVSREIATNLVDRREASDLIHWMRPDHGQPEGILLKLALMGLRPLDLA
jgi:primosomal protein N'